MSLESKIVLLIAALEANTAAHVGNVPATAAPAPTSTPSSATPPLPTQTPAPAAAVPTAPAPFAAAPVTQPVAAPAAVVSPSSVAPDITLDQLKQEVTALWQAADPTKQAAIMGAVQDVAASLNDVQPNQFEALLAAVRAI